MRWFVTTRGLIPELLTTTQHAWVASDDGGTGYIDLLGNGDLEYVPGAGIEVANAPAGYAKTFDGSTKYAFDGGTSDGEIIDTGYFAIRGIAYAPETISAEMVLIEISDDSATNPLFGVAVTTDREFQIKWYGDSAAHEEALADVQIPIGWFTWGVSVQSDDVGNTLTAKLYINGEYVGQVSDGGYLEYTGDEHWRIGCRANGAKFWNGYIGSTFLDVDMGGHMSADQFAEDHRRSRRIGVLSDSLVRVDVEDGEGEWVDMTDFAGVDWVESVEIQDGSDQRIVTAQVDLKRDHHELHLSKWHENKLNQEFVENASYPGPDETYYGDPDDAVSDTTELLELDRGIRIYSAIVPLDVEPVASDWVLVFEGKIQAVDWGSDPVQVRCSDLGVALQEATIEETYEVTGDAIEDMIADILSYADSEGWLTGAAPTVWTPTSPGVSYDTISEERRPLFEVISHYPDEIGWVIRYRWRESTGAFALKLYEPPRTVERADVSLESGDGVEIRRLSMDKADIRTVVKIVYGNATPASITKQADGVDISYDGISKYGRLFCEISSASVLHVADSTNAAKLALAVLRDLCRPTVESEIETTQARPDIEIEDQIRWVADGVTTTADLTVAVFSISHRWDAGSSSTRASMRGRPSGGHQIHLSREVRHGLPPGIGSRIDADARRDRRLRNGIREDLLNGGHLRRGRDARLANGDFEMWSFGAGLEPDGWTMDSGTWGTSATQESTQVKSATYSVKFSDTCSLTSDLFSVEEGEVLGLRTRSRVHATGGDLLDVYVGFYQGDRTTAVGSALLSHTVTDDTAWSHDSGYVAVPANARWACVILSSNCTSGEDVYLDKIETVQQTPWAKGYRTTDETLSDADTDQVSLNTEKDPWGMFDTTAFEFVPDRAGTWDIHAQVVVTAAGSGVSAAALLYINGALWVIGQTKTLGSTGSGPFGSYGTTLEVSAIGRQLVETDNVELFIVKTGTITVEGGEDNCFMMARYRDGT